MLTNPDRGQKHLRHRQDAYARTVPVGFANANPADDDNNLTINLEIYFNCSSPCLSVPVLHVCHMLFQSIPHFLLILQQASVAVFLPPCTVSLRARKIKGSCYSHAPIFDKTTPPFLIKRRPTPVTLVLVG